VYFHLFFKNYLLSEDAVNNGLEESSTNIASNIQNYEFCLSSGEGVKGNQSAVVVQRLPHIQEQVVNTVDNVQMEESAVHGILDPQTGLFYASTGKRLTFRVKKM
jgi:uncharacterized Fe-S cluster protein YjdI